jgi:hypothetical protein
MKKLLRQDIAVLLTLLKSFSPVSKTPPESKLSCVPDTAVSFKITDVVNAVKSHLHCSAVIDTYVRQTGIFWKLSDVKVTESLVLDLDGPTTTNYLNMADYLRKIWQFTVLLSVQRFFSSVMGYD